MRCAVLGEELQQLSYHNIGELRSMEDTLTKKNSNCLVGKADGVRVQNGHSGRDISYWDILEASMNVTIVRPNFECREEYVGSKPNVQVLI